MTDIFKRMRKEAEEKKNKKNEGYSSLFSKPKPKEKKVEIKSWVPPGSAKKAEETKPTEGAAAKVSENKETTKEPVKPGNDTEQYLGRYFEAKETSIGVGGTAQSQAIVVHYYAKELDGRVLLFLASNTGKPTKIEMGSLSFEDFKKKYKPCVEHDCPFD